MFTTLLSSRRFAPLFWCQLFSAFNDNFVRQMLAMLILFRFAAEDVGPKITLAVAIFALPQIPLSPLGGEIADANDKALVARRLKFAEIFVQMIAAAGFYFSSLTLLYVALFGLGCIAALFGPVKYGILPDHLRKEELVAGNALVEGATFAAIIGGLILGALAAAQGRSALSVVLQLAVVAVACWASSLFIPPTGVAARGLKINFNLWTATRDVLRDLRRDDRQWVGAIATSWFWLVGAVMLSLVPVVIKDRIGGGIEVEAAINLLFAVGIAAGSLLAAVLSHGRIELAPAPFLLLIMGCLAIDLGLTAASIPQVSGGVGLGEFFTNQIGIHIALDIVVFSTAAGLFVVPIFAAVQAWAGEDRRARVIGAVNTLNYIYIVAGSLATIALQKAAHLDEPTLLVVLGVANILAAIYFFRRLPANFLAFFLRGVWRIVFRLEVKGLENLPPAGSRNVVAVNHVSFLDAPIILSLLDDAPIFAIDDGIARLWWVKIFAKLCDARPLDPTKPLATRALIQDVRAGRRLIIFPEGRITVTGSLMKIYDGAAMIAEKAEAIVTPVRLVGPERTPFSRLGRSQVGRRLFPKFYLTILPGAPIAVRSDLRGRARRRAAGAALYNVMADLIFQTTNIRRTLTDAYEETARARGLASLVVQDPISGPLTQRRFRIGVALLAREIAAISKPGECVGLLLPNANGAAIAFMAAQAAGRVPAMLNFTAGPINIVAACQAAKVSLVLSSRAFIEKANLQNLVDSLGSQARILWLEDIRDGATFADKVRAAFQAGRRLAERSPDDPAVVLFTSGSEGAPKGVVLSHVNILANIAQISAVYDLTYRDIMFNPLPIFHSFGLTGGLLLGLIGGMRVYLYPSPLHYRQIPELIYGVNATVLLGTDTFLAGYARMANPYDFRSLRYVICEGYGVTEASPVVAVNTPMFNRNGSVGRLLPFIEYRLEPVPGIAEGGRLHLRGPNVMAGYYRADNPGQLEPPVDGWHDTGDIVAIDAEGFASIKGRAKRFAKIAGELVSLAAVEQIVAGLWPDNPPAALATPDPKKGERIVLVTTRPNATRAEVQAWMKIKGASEIMFPAIVLSLPDLPLLGSGKTDYVALQRILRERPS
jgi:acyl-[acyl-carrier-protein]-phospholipid O-acyltransferase/long-chain-fatty-acid--[acyl-carrier-protein] ligase